MNTDSSVTIREPWLPLPPKPGCAVRRRPRLRRDRSIQRAA